MSAGSGRPAIAPSTARTLVSGQFPVQGDGVYRTPPGNRTGSFREGMLMARGNTAAGDPTLEMSPHRVSTTVESLRPAMRVVVGRAPGFTPEAQTQANGRMISAHSGFDDRYWQT